MFFPKPLTPRRIRWLLIRFLRYFALDKNYTFPQWRNEAYYISFMLLKIQCGTKVIGEVIDVINVSSVPSIKFNRKWSNITSGKYVVHLISIQTFFLYMHLKWDDIQVKHSNVVKCL